MPIEPTARSLMEHALLQSVSECYLENFRRFGGPFDDLGFVLAAGSNNTVVTGADPAAPVLDGATRLTQAQIDYFSANYAIVAHYPSDASGFSCTLFRNLTTGEYTISFRSTEYALQAQGGDWERDGKPGADGDIADHGLALAQLSAMQAVYEHLRQGEVWQVRKKGVRKKGVRFIY